MTFTLAANVENLTLTGSGAINGTGNTLANVITGNTAGNRLDGGAGNDSLLGGLGDDVYVVDSTSDVVTENAGAGTDLVQSSVTFTLAANVENLTLTGGANINGTGNALGNILVGNTGNNTLNGGAGADSMAGGTGNDTYVVDDIGDIVIEAAGEGTDLVQSSVTFTLAANVENLTLTGAPPSTAPATRSTTCHRQHRQQRSTAAPATTASLGGLGNDVYVVDSTADVVTENASAGTDLVQSSVTFTLAANVENLTLTGSAASMAPAMPLTTSSSATPATIP